VFHEHDALTANHVFGGYAASKWAAEELVQQAGGVRTVRLGLLTGDSKTGRGSATCQLISFLRGLRGLGALVELGPARASALRVDITPVDYAARAFVGLADLPEGAPATFHVASEQPATWTDLTRALADAGCSLPRVSVAEFRARIARASLDRSLATTALSACRRLLDTGQRHTMSDLFLASDVRFDTTRTRSFGYRCPPADARLLGMYAREALA
jgi:thioester reductase-like protein